MNAHSFVFKSIDGGEIGLSDYAGQPVLVVNVASECGYTPQYAGLQSLSERYRDRGLVVLGVPSNDFGAQEPGDEAAIQSFCQTTYGTTFPMTAKVPVIGGEAHPFYAWIADELGEGGAPKWNFHKYLVAPDGSLAALWPSDVEPLATEVTAAIEPLLVD